MTREQFRNDRIEDIIEYVTKEWGARVYTDSPIFPHLDVLICTDRYRYEIPKGKNILIKKHDSTREELSRKDEISMTTIYNYIKRLEVY